MEQIDYKKVFSKLSHIKALSHDQKFEQIVQNLITHALNQIGFPNPKNVNEVEKRIKDLYGISIRNTIIISNLDKLMNKGDVIKDLSTNEYFVSQVISLKLSERLEKAKDLENEVQKKWFEELKIFIPGIIDENLEQLWNLLKEYLSNVFEQHGVQTLNFLNPQIKINEDDQKNLTTIIDTLFKEYEKNFSKEILVSSINQFIINADEIRAKYISQLADATFTSFALTSDAETVNFLNKRYNNLILFLDTNFIFGILDLHKNSEDGSAIEILEEVKKNKLPFKLTYHPETLAEFKRAFDARALILRASKWTRESSRIAIMVDGLSPIEELFHKQNIDHETDPTVFLEKYDHVDLILKDLGLIEYSPHRSNDDELYQIEKDVEEYQKFYNTVKYRKTKSFAGFKHDIVTLREVRALNPKKTKFLDSNAFFISSDFVLAKFERTHYKRNWEINYVVNPSVFLQLMRPFIENDYSSNKRFIDTFSIPEFRAFEIDYSSTRSKALQIINDNYHSTSLETKVKILRDQVLLEKLDKVNDDYEKQITIIENQIAIENQILASEKDDALSESVLKDKQITGLSDKIDTIQKDLQKEKLKNIYLEKIEKWKSKKEEFITKKVKEKREEFFNASKYCLRPIVLMIFVVVASPLVIKFYNEIKSYLNSYNISEFWLISIIMFILFIVLFELIYRTFIVDKEKVKMGILWICTFGQKVKKKKLLASYKKNIEEEYYKLNPEPVLDKDI